MENQTQGSVLAKYTVTDPKNRSSEGLMKPCSVRLCLSTAVGTGFAWGLFLKAMGRVGELLPAEQGRGARLGWREMEADKMKRTRHPGTTSAPETERVAQERWQIGEREKSGEAQGEQETPAPWP